MRSSCVKIPLIERRLLTRNPIRKVFHLSFDINSVKIDYEVGDFLGIYPRNDLSIVESFIRSFNLNGDQIVYFSREGRFLTFQEYLVSFANLDRIPSFCKSWLERKFSQDFSLYRFHELFSLFENADLFVSEQYFVDSLSILLPRFYSIASYNLFEDNIKKIDLLVNLIILKEDPKVFGTCSSYLCSSLPLNQPIAEVFLKKSRNFSLSSLSEDKPIIMVGTGTGLAPFRGFLQKRKLTSSFKGNYLFFGDWYSSDNFYYKSFFDELVKEDILQVFSAFSRDQEEKLYVQHLFLEQKDLVRFVLDQSGYVFVCGSKSLGKAIDAALLQILEESHGLTEAKKIIKDLRIQNRYVKDVY